MRTLIKAIRSLAQGHASACLLCRLYPAQPARSVCANCWQELPWLLQATALSHQSMPHHILPHHSLPNRSMSHSVQAACHYVWPVDRLIHQYKYQQRLELLPILHDILLQTPKPAVQALVAVPSSPEKLVTRGFNPTLLLAQQLSKTWQIPLWQPLSRHHTPAQQGLSQTERFINLQDAFYINTDQCRVIYRKILIIDDVMTTGSTLAAMQQQLDKLGVQQIQSLVIARA
ncbi:ComF family protein [Alkanindiges illinoisensis]|uniref:ComF family protein n=2 Tax=Alkanindiges illinoisensis TaxID=197183 RepID=A0A4Y7XA97_9GAMM|nr:ComF family protein [Alkanindiges illinoisensis]